MSTRDQGELTLNYKEHSVKSIIVISFVCLFGGGGGVCYFSGGGGGVYFVCCKIFCVIIHNPIEIDINCYGKDVHRYTIKTCL